MILLKKFGILLIIPLMAFTLHKYYISLTQIDYNPQEKSLHITIRLFIDDIEKSLNTNFKKDFKLDTPKELEKTNDFIAFYLNTHFNIKVNDTLRDYSFLGKEYENDVIYLYVEIDSISNIKSVGIQNRILISEFETQQNIIKLNINNQKKTMILNKSNDKDLLNF
jgi:Domain of unknown function (DUF6702)